MIPDRQNTQTQWPWLTSATDFPQQPVQLPAIDFTGQLILQHLSTQPDPSKRPQMVSLPAPVESPHKPIQFSEIRVWNIPQWTARNLSPQTSQQNVNADENN